MTLLTKKENMVKYISVLSAILSVCFFSIPSFSSAQQFYPAATTVYFDASTTVKYWTILPTSTRTVLGITLMTDTSNKTEILCGNTELFDNWGNNNIPFAAMQNVCNAAIRLVKTSNGAVATNITYIDGYIPTETGGTATTSIMTGGDMVISFFILLILFVAIMILIITITTGIRIKETAKDFIHE